MSQEIATLINAMNDLKNEVSGMKNSVREFKTSLDHVTSSNDKLVAEVANVTKRLDKMDSRLTINDHNYKNLLHKYNELNERVVSLESYSRRDNLLFTGVTEAPGEDCAEKIYDILENTMEIEDARGMRFVRCHRLGAPPSIKPNTGTHGSRPRTIICRFHFFGDRQKVWQARKNLKESEYIVNEDFPKEIMDKRNMLAPIMYAAKRAKKTAYLVVDKLHIVTGEGDDKVTDVYDVNSLNNLPPELDPLYVSTIQKNKTFAFFGQNCPLSNFHPAPFTCEGENYRHVEEYFFMKKAEFANDDITKERIRNAKTPADCKRLGRGIKIDKKQWQQREAAIMKKALYEKFSQNHALKDYLMRTGDCSIAEASPSDTFWGIGVGLRAVASSKAKQFKWTGKNKLGHLLMELRTEFE